MLLHTEKFVSNSGIVLSDNKDKDDEYDNLNDLGETYLVDELELESGEILKKVAIRFTTHGSLNQARDNCLVVCHSLTGNASINSWWGSMLGKGKLFDYTRMFIVCANVLGSCYGTCGPTSINPANEEVYGTDFPYTTIRDSVSLHMKLVKEHLLVNKVACVIGGSLGGMHALEWAAIGGNEFVGAVIPMCCGAFHNSWQISISESQRQAIYTDPAWRDGRYLKEKTVLPMQGIAVARAIAMISYRSHSGYSRKFGRTTITETDNPTSVSGSHFQVERYLQYQGQKFCKRFDALSYVSITRMMDSHDLGRGREGGIEGALSRIVQPVLIISVKSDVLYPPSEQIFLQSKLPNATLFTIDSDQGHDSFLLNQEQILEIGIAFLEKYVYANIVNSSVDTIST